MSSTIGKSNAAVARPQPVSVAPSASPVRAVASTARIAAPTWTPPLTGEWTTDPASGKPSDPVNMYLHGSLEQVTHAFAAAGWTEAHPASTVNKLRFGAVAVPGWIERGIVNLWDKITGRHDHLTNGDPLYHEVNSEPVDTLLLDGKPQALAFEKDNNPFGGRHHLRIYDTGKVDERGEPVWAVAASRDIGLKFDIHRPGTFFLDHVAEKNTDLERDTVLRDLRSGGVVQSVQTYSANWGGQLQVEDGRFYDIALK